MAAAGFSGGGTLVAKVDNGDPLRALGQVLKRACVKLSARDFRHFLLVHAERLAHTPGREITMEFVMEAESVLEGMLESRMAGRPKRRARAFSPHLLQ